MDWYEFKKLINLTCDLFFAKNKATRDCLWKQFEAAVIYASEHYPYKLPSENKDDTSSTLAKKFYKSWVQFSYPTHPGKKLQIIVAQRINCTFGVSFCLENNVLSIKNHGNNKEANTFFRKQKLESNPSAEALTKERAGFFKIKKANDLAENSGGKIMSFKRAL